VHHYSFTFNLAAPCFSHSLIPTCTCHPVTFHLSPLHPVTLHPCIHYPESCWFSSCSCFLPTNNWNAEATHVPPRSFVSICTCSHCHLAPRHLSPYHLSPCHLSSLPLLPCSSCLSWSRSYFVSQAKYQGMCRHDCWKTKCHLESLSHAENAFVTISPFHLSPCHLFTLPTFIPAFVALCILLVLMPFMFYATTET